MTRSHRQATEHLNSSSPPSTKLFSSCRRKKIIKVPGRRTWQNSLRLAYGQKNLAGKCSNYEMQYQVVSLKVIKKLSLQ